MLTELVLNVLSVPLTLLFSLLGTLLTAFGVTIAVDQLEGITHILSCVGYFVPLSVVTFVLGGMTTIYTARFILALFRTFKGFNKTAGS